VSLDCRAVRRRLFLWASAGQLAGVLVHRGLLAVRTRRPVGRVGIVGDGSLTSKAAGGSPVGADSDGQQAACRSYGPSTGQCPCGCHAHRKPQERPAGGLVSQAGAIRWSGGGSRGAPSSASRLTGQERLGPDWPVAVRAWVAVLPRRQVTTGVLLTGQVGATSTQTRQGRGLPRTRRAGGTGTRILSRRRPVRCRVVSHMLI
jgi:hypothetical protein